MEGSATAPARLRRIMFQRLRRARQLDRAKPGDGSAMKDLRWWQLFTRTLFFLDPDEQAGRPSHYMVDVRHLAAELEGVPGALGDLPALELGGEVAHVHGVVGGSPCLLVGIEEEQGSR